MGRTLVFIINPKAGSGKGRLLKPRLEEFLKQKNVKYRIEFTGSKDHATELAKQAVKDNHCTVIAVGGDGTVNETAKGITGTNTPMGIIPTGSGNGLARHYKIPMQLTDALEVILKNHHTSHDAVEINSQLSFNVSGIGFDAHVASLFGANGQRGLTGYARLVIREYFRYKEFDCTCSLSSGKFPAMFAAIATTSQFGNNAFIAPQADPGDGVTNLTVVRKLPMLMLITFIINIFNKNIRESSYVSMFKGSEFKISASREVPLHIDGEPAGNGSEFTIRTIKNAIQLIVPEK